MPSAWCEHIVTGPLEVIFQQVVLILQHVFALLQKTIKTHFSSGFQMRFWLPSNARQQHVPLVLRLCALHNKESKNFTSSTKLKNIHTCIHLMSIPAYPCWGAELTNLKNIFSSIRKDHFASI